MQVQFLNSQWDLFFLSIDAQLKEMLSSKRENGTKECLLIARVSEEEL
jgi:hypothetical protein